MVRSVEDVVGRFKDLSILVLGDFMLDEYVEGTVDRISPEAPVPVVLENRRRLLPGGAGNVVANLSALGGQVALAGIIGRDPEGDFLRRTFATQGIRPDKLALLETDRPTTRKTRILAGTHQICRLDREASGLIPEADEERLWQAIAGLIDTSQGIIISDYDKGVVTPRIIEQTVKRARSRNIFVAVDPQVSHFHYYKNVGVLTPNHHEAGRFLGRKLHTDEDVRAGGFEIQERLGSDMLLITRGEKGMTLFEKGQCMHFPTMAREVFDVTGAGDTVISVFTLVMAAQGKSAMAVELSNKAAGIVVGHIGASTVKPEELIAYV